MPLPNSQTASQPNSQHWKLGVGSEKQIGSSQMNESSPKGAANRIRARGRAELSVDRREVKLHRVLADPEALRDRAIAEAVSERSEHLQLSRGALLADTARLIVLGDHH